MITAVLGRRNDWWATGKSSVDSAYKLARNELNKSIDGLASRRIQIIIGPRRVGKSTLMQQTIGHLLKTGVEPKRILFFSCDDPTLFDGNTSILTYLSQAYMTAVLSNYAPNAGKTLRKNKTLYVLDNGIANAMLRLPEINDTQAGHIVESVP